MTIENVRQEDPYRLDPSRVEDPPTSLLGKLKHVGPGFILSASIVGSGELIATTALGAKAGFATLWVILVSCVVKVAIQLEFGRYAIQTGQPCMAAFNRLPGVRLGRAHWSIWCWLLLQPVKVLQVGGIVGGVGQLLAIVFPALGVAAWCLIVAAVVATLVCFERYRFIERTSLVLLGVFTLFTLASVAALQWTPYAVSAADLAGGLQFRLPEGALLFVLGVFGITGVGGDEIMHYTYWLIEKGYAAKTGPYRENDPDWRRRAQGWTRIMYLDALLSMVAYTVVTAAFYILGAAVLHVRGQLPEGYQMIETLAMMYTETIGPGARALFLAGAFVVLFSTLFAALAAWTRVFTDAFGQIGWLDFQNPRSRRLSFAVLAWTFPLLWTFAFLRFKAPVQMVMIGGVGTGLILLIVVYAAACFRFRQTAAALRPGRFYDAALAVSAAVIVVVALYGAYEAVALAAG